MLFFPPAPTGWIIETSCETNEGVAKHCLREGKWPSTAARDVGPVARRTNKYGRLFFGVVVVGHECGNASWFKSSRRNCSE